MKFTKTRLEGAYLIQPEPVSDERGFFARSWCVREFGSFGLDTRLVQCNISYNRRKGTLRGMHYQVPPFEEDKLVRCTRGAIYDVIVDLRRNSETFAACAPSGHACGSDRQDAAHARPASCR